MFVILGIYGGFCEESCINLRFLAPRTASLQLRMEVLHLCMASRQLRTEVLHLRMEVLQVRLTLENEHPISWLGHADARQVSDLPTRNLPRYQRSMTAGRRPAEGNKAVLPASPRLAAHQHGQANI